MAGPEFFCSHNWLQSHSCNQCCLVFGLFFVVSSNQFSSSDNHCQYVLDNCQYVRGSLPRLICSAWHKVSQWWCGSCPRVILERSLCFSQGRQR
eukprot:g12753.t1